MESNEFAELYFKAVSQGRIGEMLKLMHKEVCCSKCRKVITSARDAREGVDFYCPKCGVAWFITPK